MDQKAISQRDGMRQGWISFTMDQKILNTIAKKKLDIKTYSKRDISIFLGELGLMNRVLAKQKAVNSDGCQVARPSCQLDARELFCFEPTVALLLCHRTGSCCAASPSGKRGGFATPEDRSMGSAQRAPPSVMFSSSLRDRSTSRCC